MSIDDSALESSEKKSIETDDQEWYPPILHDHGRYVIKQLIKIKNPDKSRKPLIAKSYDRCEWCNLKPYQRIKVKKVWTSLSDDERNRISEIVGVLTDSKLSKQERNLLLEEEDDNDDVILHNESPVRRSTNVENVTRKAQLNTFDSSNVDNLDEQMNAVHVSRNVKFNNMNESTMVEFQMSMNLLQAEFPVNDFDEDMRQRILNIKRNAIEAIERLQESQKRQRQE
jgi:hypothetical protein